MEGPIPEDEDAQLKLAIALSLGEPDPRGDPTDPSGAAAEAVTDECDTKKRVHPSTESTIPTAQTDMQAKRHQGLLALDRAAMEQERLARLASAREKVPMIPRDLKRPTEESDPAIVNGSDRVKRHRPTPGVTPKINTGSAPPSIRWPQGVVKRTWCYGFERTESDIKIEEVLQKNTLQLAVLSSFIWDVEWILSKIQSNTKLIMVMHAKDETTRQQYKDEAGQIPNRQIRLCFPPMGGNVNCMHSKLMLLAHPDHLRIVVPTANLVAFDWGETGVMENTVFIIDLPRHEDGHVDAESDLTFFGQELTHFCRAKGLSEDSLRSLGKFDFTATKHMAFVHSIGGEHRSASERARSGYPGLGRSIRHLGLQTNAPLRIDCVTSSIGALDESFLQRLYLACKGDDGQIEYTQRTAPKTKSARVQNDPAKSDLSPDNTVIRNAFRLYFPSDQTVRQSRGGPANAGTVCFNERWYNAPTFHQPLLRDCQSVRSGVLMHNKLLFVQDADPSHSGNDSKPGRKAWIYVGSANCSDSAWGRLVKDRSTKEPKLTCRNWECGVVLPVSEVSDPGSKKSSDTGLEIFASRMTVPMKIPSKVLVDHGLQPWFF